MPDELLERIDRIVASRNTSRSAVIRGFAEESFQARQDRLNQILDEIEANAEPHGGDSVELLRQDRSR